jgi:hypothetical protein
MSLIDEMGALAVVDLDDEEVCPIETGPSLCTD